MIAIKYILIEEKSLWISRHSFILFSFFLLISVILLFHYSRLPTTSYLVSSLPPSVQKYQPFKLLISPNLSLLYPAPSLSVSLSPLFSPASFLPVARLLLLSEVLNFMPDFLSASAHSHRDSLSSYWPKMRHWIRSLYLQLCRSLNQATSLNMLLQIYISMSWFMYVCIWIF